MTRPRLLDAFCCQGGASAGYAAAGFDVTGIDLHPQPRYPYRFIQGDAVEYIRNHGHEYDAIAGSPPCQGYSDAQVLQGRDHPMLIAPTRDAMNATGRPWIIENVPGAAPHLIDPVVLCGAMFGLGTYRDRYFEAGGGLTLTQPHHPRHDKPITKMGRPRRPGEMAHYVGNFSGVQAARDDLQVPWMNRDGIRECIPPAYTQHLGRQLIQHLTRIPA
ncbi:DNA (cytosine-5)-methyltransferase 1 [Streptomyces sp. PvR006]|uniref:DNA cytosine methyltransferase n=1 Tax=Streptomyces sp. PvR006 TaxID=2817860 RepID=UPI001AE7075C|nr:DNA cytosine methyltransferase [Streptomyces sp. PvR006]MBP2581874.1 DNA (cytosine-5)-methyltransferase 1 [Streptomyces sp. PvR006]